MASNEGHIHWDGSQDFQVEYLGQSLQITSEDSNASTVHQDPEGTLRIRTMGESADGLTIPTQTGDWEAIPGTIPTLQARAGGATDIIRLRIA